MSFVAVAIGGSALGAGGSLFSGLMGSGAERRRASAIQAAGEQGVGDIMGAIDRSNQTAREFNTTARGDLSPFRQFGVNAGNTLTSLLFGGGDVSQALKASPLFNFQSEMGTRNINRELAARGLYGSGAGLQTLQQFNDQLVGEEGQRLFDRLFNLTNLGANSANSMAGLTNQTGLSMANNIFSGGVDAANMRFNSAVGAAGARANATNMLGQMGQNIFDTGANALTQFGNFKMMSPILKSLNESQRPNLSNGPREPLFSYSTTTAE